jgi:N-methylhydantoinase A/oxoprolinase/acetone carboxylase beta subunit
MCIEVAFAERLAARIVPGDAAELTAGKMLQLRAKSGERGVIFYERGLQRVPTPIYDGAVFAPGMALTGPAVVELPDTTLVLRDAERATVDAAGSVVIDL